MIDRPENNQKKDEINRKSYTQIKFYKTLSLHFIYRTICMCSYQSSEDVVSKVIDDQNEDIEINRIAANNLRYDNGDRVLLAKTYEDGKRRIWTLTQNNLSVYLILWHKH